MSRKVRVVSAVAEDAWRTGALRKSILALWPVQLALSAAITFVISASLVFFVELIARDSLEQTLQFFSQPYRPGWTTVALFAMLLVSVDALLGRAHNALLVIGPLAILMAWIGSQKAIYLGDPLYPTDFLYSRQIVELLPLLVRERPFTAATAVLGVVIALATLFIAWRFWRRRFPALPMKSRALRLLLTVPALAFFVSIMDYATFSWARDRMYILPMMWDQKENYHHNGFALAFALNVPMANVMAPKGYSAEAIEQIMPSSGAPAAGTAASEKPDIIIVMNESFWDSTRLPGIEITPDPLANTRTVQSGHVFSPEFGGMTANVEFEALTGFSNAFLPYGSIPYQQYVRGDLPSLATFLRNQGYRTTAIHPFAAWFWNRGDVYQAFGFDQFYSEENLPPLPKRGTLASDAAFTEQIIREAERSDAPSFIFGVSLQNHGPYEPGRYSDPTHQVTGSVSKETRDSILSYAEGAADADKSLQRLVEWASAREKPTIIAFFGDHLPPLGPVYVETGFLKESVPPRREPADALKLHRETPLVVWSNREGTVKDIGTVSPAFLPVHVLEAAGLSHPYYTGFLKAVHQDYNVIDRHLLLARDGLPTPDWSREKDIDPLIRDFRLLQYDMMFGKRYGVRRFFPDSVHHQTPAG